MISLTRQDSRGLFFRGQTSLFLDVDIQGAKELLEKLVKLNESRTKESLKLVLDRSIFHRFMKPSLAEEEIELVYDKSEDAFNVFRIHDGKPQWLLNYDALEDAIWYFELLVRLKKVVGSPEDFEEMRERGEEYFPDRELTTGATIPFTKEGIYIVCFLEDNES